MAPHAKERRNVRTCEGIAKAPFDFQAGRHCEDDAELQQLAMAHAELLEMMPPFLGGGEMILNVTKEGFTTTEIPWKFEAGTPMVAEAVGLGAAIDYLSELGMENVRAHEIELTAYALRTLNERHGDKIVIHGPQVAEERGGVLSFVYGEPDMRVHPHDIAQVLDQAGVCVRAGHHCAKPLLQTMNVPATSRASCGTRRARADRSGGALRRRRCAATGSARRGRPPRGGGRWAWRDDLA